MPRMAHLALVRHGCLFARPTGAINLKMPQAPTGLIGRKTVLPTFAVLKVGPPEGHTPIASFWPKMKAPGRDVHLFTRKSDSSITSVYLGYRGVVFVTQTLTRCCDKLL